MRPCPSAPGGSVASLQLRIFSFQWKDIHGCQLVTACQRARRWVLRSPQASFEALKESMNQSPEAGHFCPGLLESSASESPEVLPQTLGQALQPRSLGRCCPWLQLWCLLPSGPLQTLGPPLCHLNVLLKDRIAIQSRMTIEAAVITRISLCFVFFKHILY